MLRRAWVAGLSGMALCLAIGAAFGQAPKSGKELVAVLDLDALGASKNQVAAVSERLREELLATGNYRIVDRAQMDKVLEEQALQQAGCTSQECAVQVGRILGVRKLITGKVNRVESGLWLISCNMIDAESAEIVRAVSFQHKGDFSSLLADGAPQLVGKLTEASGAGQAAGRPPGRGSKLADATLQVADVPPDAKVFLNGAEKGQGPQQFAQLAPGQYEILVRRTSFRPFKQSVTLAAGQAVRVEPKFAELRLAVFPIRRTGSWSIRDTEEHTTGWATRGVKAAADRAKLKVSHSVHSDDKRNPAKYGNDLRSDPDVGKNAWTLFGNPEMEFALRKARQLDVDAVLYLSLTTGVSSTTGGWKAKLVDTHSGAVVEDSGIWPYGSGSTAGITEGITPLFQRYVKTGG